MVLYQEKKDTNVQVELVNVQIPVVVFRVFVRIRNIPEKRDNKNLIYIITCSLFGAYTEGKAKIWRSSETELAKEKERSYQ